jgi:bacterioferritin
MSVTEAPEAILDIGLERERREIVELLTQAYWMEIEIVMNYLAASISHDGARSRKVKDALLESVEEEVQHAQRIGRRIQELHRAAPPAGGLAIDHESLHAPDRPSDVVAMLEAMAAAETAAIQHYARIMRASARVDRATYAIAAEFHHDEERHLQLFEGYLRECRPAA